MSLLTKDEANTRAASSEYLDEFVLTDLVFQLMMDHNRSPLWIIYGRPM